MNKTSSRTWFGPVSVLLLAISFACLAGAPVASPSEQITKAVADGGASNIQQASGDNFIQAFGSVLVGVDQKQSPAYVSAALQMRPDLANGIKATAAEIASLDTDTGDVDDPAVSQHHKKCTICCNGVTRRLPCQKAKYKVEHCPGCAVGACPSA